MVIWFHKMDINCFWLSTDFCIYYLLAINKELSLSIAEFCGPWIISFASQIQFLQFLLQIGASYASTAGHSIFVSWRRHWHSLLSLAFFIVLYLFFTFFCHKHNDVTSDVPVDGDHLYPATYYNHKVDPAAATFLCCLCAVEVPVYFNFDFKLKLNFNWQIHWVYGLCSHSSHSPYRDGPSASFPCHALAPFQKLSKLEIPAGKKTHHLLLLNFPLAPIFRKFLSQMQSLLTILPMGNIFLDMQFVPLLNMLLCVFASCCLSSSCQVTQCDLSLSCSLC